MKIEYILGIAIAVVAAMGLLLFSTGSGAINVADGETLVAMNGKCSLREAIDNANDTKSGKIHSDCKSGDPAGMDVVILKSESLYNFVDAPYEESGFNALPILTSEIIIEGNDATITRDKTLDCQWVEEEPTEPFRFIFVSNTAILTLRDVTFTNGCALGTRFDKDGGAIFNNVGTLKIENTTLIKNFAQRNGGAIYSNRATGISISNSELADNESQNGGAIYSNGAKMVELHAVSIERNMVTTSGGGIYSVGGPLSISESVISANSADLYGGAMFFSRGKGLVENSSLNGNATNDSGGAIYNDLIGDLTIINSNISFNSTRSYGAAIYNYLNGNVQIMNSTFTQNAAPNGIILNTGQIQISFSTITQNIGSGLTNFGEAALIAIANSIIALNQTQADCQVRSGRIQAIGQNMDADGSCRVLTGGGSFVTADPLLDPAGLQSNGGPTMTIALLPGSPAIDVILECGILLDQRGNLRPEGGPCDLGAFELSKNFEEPD
jgi:predicted outer membrane repeat protein